MVPEGWPAAASAGDRSVELARGAGRGRLSTVRQDFFLPPAHRLTEQERALMTAMLHGLIGEIRDELSAGSSTASDDVNDVVAVLSSSGLLDRPGLVSLLLRAAEEEQASASLHPRTRRGETQPLQGLISDPDPAIAAAAMALILARGRRQDRFGQLRVDFDDLGPDDAIATVHAVAAAITSAGSEQISTMAEAADALLQRHHPARSLDALAGDVVSALDASERLSDEFIGSLAEGRDIALLVHALARRAAIDLAEAAEVVYSRANGEVALLLRMAGVSRDCAATILSILCDALGTTDPEQAIELFDDLKPQDVHRSRAWRNLPESYRVALILLGRADG